MRNLHLTFDYSTYSQKLGEDFAKFCGLLRIYELYIPLVPSELSWTAAAAIKGQITVAALEYIKM